MAAFTERLMRDRLSSVFSVRPTQTAKFLLSHHRIQPTIHHVIGHRRLQFHVFFKNHMNLLRNQHVQPWSSWIWRGDTFVLHKGVEKEFVNISRRDTLFANFAVRWWVYSSLDFWWAYYWSIPTMQICKSGAPRQTLYSKKPDILLSLIVIN